RGSRRESGPRRSGRPGPSRARRCRRGRSRQAVGIDGEAGSAPGPAAEPTRPASPAARSQRSRLIDTARSISLSGGVSSAVNEPRLLEPAKKMPVSAPRLRISCTASRAASVAASDASTACTSFFMSVSTGRSLAIGIIRYHTGHMASWTPLSSSVRYTRRTLAPREDGWRLPDGSERTYPVLVGGVAVGILAFVDDARVVLVRQYRHLPRVMSWELPGGGALPGE